jgi:hypothetical protein
MLNTINGFDLLLIITIVILAFKVYNLNRECESYVGQIMELAQELNEIHYYKYKSLEDGWGKPSEAQVEAALATYPHTGCLCNYCTDSDPWLREFQDEF